MSKTWKSILEEYPELIQYFKAPQQGKRSITSKTKAIVTCPCCKKQHSVAIRTIAFRGNTHCSTCGDTYSYPERFMSAVLDMLGVNFIVQFYAPWLNLRRFDFYFKYNNTHYLLETDGGIGHGHKKGPKAPNESLAIDIEKDGLGESHGYKIIRIDCDYGNNNRFLTIKGRIQQSELSHLFDLSIIDWEECNRKASSSKIIQIIELYNSGTTFIEDISEILHIPKRTVKAILLELKANGRIPNEMFLERNVLKDCPVTVVMNRKYQGTKTCPVYCYEDAIAFGSTYDADDYYGYPKFTVRNSISSYNGSHKNKHFVKYDELPKNFDFKPLFFPDNEYRYHAYCQWTLDGTLVNIFEDKHALPKNYQYQAVQRVINGMYNTAYGYKWTILPKELEYEWLKIPKEERFEQLNMFEQILKKKGCV